MTDLEKTRNFLIADVHKRLFIEGSERIKKCLSHLSTEQIWHKQNDNTNSVGNLILHLCGNVTQYVLHGIDGQTDIRQRSLEFSETGPLPTELLVSKLEELEAEVSEALNRVQPRQLTENRTVQGFDENVTSILVHVAEHFSYHVGQITFYTKYILDIDTGYYAGLDLDVTG